jgi:pilus assembly protein Flp/PilA
MLKRFTTDEDGADLIEYALLAGLISFACFLALTSTGTSLNGFFTGVATKLAGILP